ncbi:MAG: YncE family protein [Stagnimonas sp.]|nr:YncE family protein [Stagnimonas sp.]
MLRHAARIVRALTVALVLCQLDTAQALQSFESAHVRPLALSSDGQRLYAVNTPDNRLTIYRTTDAGLSLEAEIPVGLEPVAVALRTNAAGRTEAWVVNHLSDSISVVEINPDQPRLSQVTRTLLVGDEPRDIVFAGAQHDRAFVSAAHRGQNRPGDSQLNTEGIGRADVWVFDANQLGAALAGTPLTILQLFGDTPRALAATPDGSTVYAAVFASGSKTTAIPSPAVSSFGGLPPAPEGATPDGPVTGLIVKNVDGTWVDETGKDWSALVPFSLPDYDLFQIDATANPPSETAKIAGVGTMLFNMAVRPDNGAVYVSNTEAFNEVRFEPMMTGKFAQNRVSVIKGGAVTPVHLNPHIDYSVPTGTLVEIDQSLASPADLVFSADGARVFVAGFSSDAVGLFGTDALESGQIDKQMIRVGQGPSGLALDDARDRLYVMNRLEGSISVIASASKAEKRKELARVALPYDPTPQAVKDGRQFLYDARISSGHGDLSCHTCHVFADTDHLAWDLGNPFGSVTQNPNEKANVTGVGNQALDETFHPMKGPMTTQSLRGMADAGPMHWRGDKTGGLGLDGAIDPNGDFLDEHAAFLRFNGAFVGLQGRAEELGTEQMDAYANFALKVRYPPSPIKALDNADSELEAEGREIYMDDATAFAGAFACNECHQLPITTTGLAASAGFETTRFFKIPHFRNMYTRVGKFGVPLGMTLSLQGQITLALPNYLGDQVRGFGFTHDGSIDTIDTFLHNFTFLPFPTAGNPIPDPTAPAISPDRRAALEAFILATDTGLKPIVGQQLTLSPATAEDTAVLDRLTLLLARAEAGDAELVVKGWWDGAARGALYQPGGQFRTDRAAEPALSSPQLLELAAVEGQTLTLTAVPPGDGERIGIDRDLDGVLDGDAKAASPAPADPSAEEGGNRGGVLDPSLLLSLLVLLLLGRQRRRTPPLGHPQPQR